LYFKREQKVCGSIPQGGKFNRSNIIPFYGLILELEA